MTRNSMATPYPAGPCPPWLSVIVPCVGRVTERLYSHAQTHEPKDHQTHGGRVVRQGQRRRLLGRGARRLRRAGLPVRTHRLRGAEPRTVRLRARDPGPPRPDDDGTGAQTGNRRHRPDQGGRGPAAAGRTLGGRSHGGGFGEAVPEALRGQGVQARDRGPVPPIVSRAYRPGAGRDAGGFGGARTNRGAGA